MDVNYEYYKIFYYVAKYENISKAAHALGSSQPNVTRVVNCLEQQTRCTLFIRTNRGVSLTPEGKRLYGHVAPLWRSFRRRKRSSMPAPGWSMEASPSASARRR